MAREEIIIVGAGLAGASAAWNLARRGESVTVLERTTPANPLGSSHGSARIFRYAYPEQLYCDLVVRARRGWDELEAESGQALIQVTGCVDFGEGRGPEALAAILRRAGVEHELLSAEAAADRWPQIRFDTPVLWQPGAGVLDPDRTVTAMLDLACASGHGQLLTDWEAVAIERTRTGLRVRSSTGETVAGSQVILAVGGWLPDAVGGFGMPARLVAGMPPLEVRQEQAYHFPYRALPGPSGPSASPAVPASGWPAFIHKTAELNVYGLPGGRDAGFAGQKVAQYNGGPSIGSASAQDGLIRAENRARMVAYVRSSLPGLDPEPYAETTCLFTTTPNEDFIFDTEDGVAVVSACSGHGAKFAPLLGELAADLVLGTGAVPREFRLA